MQVANRVLSLLQCTLWKYTAWIPLHPHPKIKLQFTNSLLEKYNLHRLE